MKPFLRDIILLVLGVAVLVLLLLLGALAQNWVALPCFLGAAVVFHTWFAYLLLVVQRAAGVDLSRFEDDEDDDEPRFPTA
jgi:uncharacterized membrane protein (Fun14 family)